MYMNCVIVARVSTRVVCTHECECNIHNRMHIRKCNTNSDTVNGTCTYGLYVDSLDFLCVHKSSCEVMERGGRE